MRTSLLISTYNWEDALKLVLLSANQQTIQPNEILIADDGSRTSTKKIIDVFSQKLNIKHVWHEDNGFQKTIILNKAIAQTNSDYIIQIDGDIIMHKNFIKDHISKAKKGQFIHGSRVFLNKALTKKTLKNQHLYFSFFQKGISNRMNTINSNFLANIMSKSNNDLKGTRGCNFSFWKNDFISVNGYNEEMNGWGKEDSELSVRLMNKGCKKLQLKFNATCYHLHHKINNKKNISINTDILQQAIIKKISYCKKGIKQYENRDK